MEIIIEIGTQEEKELIAQELKLFEIIPQQFDPPLNLTRIIIAENIDERVNELQGTAYFKSEKGLRDNSVYTIGKIIKDGDGYAIVVSPILYTESYDTLVRYFILIHELVHVVNKRKFPRIPTDSYVSGLYTNNLYVLYDEYYADRMAYHICDILFPEKSQFWIRHLDQEANGFIKLLTDSNYYEAIKSEIDSFRSHANVEEFLLKIHPYYDVVSIVLSHTYALLHQFSEKISEAKLSKSRFVNEKTNNLMEYFSLKFTEGAFELEDGTGLIIDFMTNFGVKFEPREFGGYCNVLDI